MLPHLPDCETKSQFLPELAPWVSRFASRFLGLVLKLLNQSKTNYPAKLRLPRFHRAGPSTSLDERYLIGREFTMPKKGCQIRIVQQDRSMEGLEQTTLGYTPNISGYFQYLLLDFFLKSVQNTILADGPSRKINEESCYLAWVGLQSTKSDGGISSAEFPKHSVVVYPHS